MPEIQLRLASANIEADEDGWNDDIRNFQKAWMRVQKIAVQVEAPENLMEHIERITFDVQKG